MSASADRTVALQAQLARQVEALANSDEWARMLETASRFHRYSPNNVLLIMLQRPTASRVAGYRTWTSLGRQVRQGERGIAILAPCTYRKKSDDDTEDEVRVFFKVAYVFDIGQTDGPDLADGCRPVLLDGDAPAGLFDSLAAQVASAGFSLELGQPAHPGANGTTEYGARRVIVRDDVSPAQQCKTLTHELAHVLMHAETTSCRGLVEVEAESVAYIVSAASGLPTEAYSTAYVARWANGDMAVVKSTADRVLRTARAILDTIEAGTRHAEVVAA